MLLTCANAEAQTGKPVLNKYYAEHFGEDEGLLQNSVNAIFPDNNDFLWIATEGGITRFNGNRFLQVPVATNITGRSLTRTKSFYLKSKDTLLAFSAANSQMAQIVHNKIISIDRAGNDNFGLRFLNLHTTIPAPVYLLQRETADAVMKDWDIKSGGALGAVYNKDTFMVVLNDGIGIYNAVSQIGKITLDKDISSLVLFIKGGVIYVDKQHFINLYSPSGLVKKEPLNVPSKGKMTFFPNNYENNFFCISDAMLYMVTVVDGKAAVHKLLDSIQHAEDITVIYQKDSNTIVTGTARNGLYVYKKQYFLPTEPLPENEPDAYYGQQLLRDNETIFTGMDKFYRNGRLIRKATIPVSTNTYSSIKDHTGYYWYVFFNKILRASDIGAPADTILTLKGMPSLFFEDDQRRIWLRDDEQFGYFSNGQFTRLAFKNLNPKLISCIRQDSKGRYFIGTRSGLFILKDINSGSVTEMPAFEAKDIRFLLPEENNMWACTYGHGFYFITKDSVIGFPQAAGKLSYVHCMIEDSKGYWWIPTNNGLFVTSNESLKEYIKNRYEIPFYYQFSKKHGLRTNEFNGGGQPPFLRLPDGTISLASMQGLVSFNPDRIQFNFSSSPILLDNIEADSIAMAGQDDFDIKSNVSNIRFSLSSSFWGEKENDLLEYRLLGKGKADGQWMPVDGSGTINIFSPSHGSYQLIVRKRKGLKHDDYLYKVVRFQVLPKWYQTNEFLLAAMLSALLIAIGLSVWRRNYYRKATRILKEKVDAATLKLQEANSTLEAKVEHRTVAIQEAERKFRDLVEKSLVGVYIFKSGKFVYVNPRLAEIFGYKQQELIDMESFDTLVFETDRDMVMANLNPTLKENAPSETHYEMRGVRKDGTLIHTEVFGRKTQFEGSNAIIGTLLDISEKKIGENQLIAEKDLSQSILNGLPGVLFIFDQDRKHLLWNKNFEQVTGYTAEELKEKPAGKCVEEADIVRFTEAVEKIYHSGSAEVEVMLINKTKAKIPFYVNGIAITYNGKPCVLGVGIDISERKRAEREREQANYELNERIKELTTLYRAGLILQKEDRSLHLTMQDLVAILPSGWQHSEITRARITIGEEEFSTTGFRIGPYVQTAVFETATGTTGKIEIVYLEDKKPEQEGPFLAEERNLIDMLADMVRTYLTRSEALHAVQKSEANLNTIFENTDTIYLLLDMDFKLIAFNQRASDYSEKELKERLSMYTSFADYLPGNTREEFIANAKNVMQGHQLSYEINYAQPSGAFTWYYVRMLPILNSIQAVFGMMVVISDITEKKVMEQEKIDRKIQEQKMIIRAILTGEEKERNKIGQELHDNVNQILASTKLFLSMAKGNKQQENGIIVESMKMLDRAIEEIRAFSKGKVTPMTKVNLEELLQTLIESFAETTHIAADFVYSGCSDLIGDDLKINIYRIVQEQLNNIQKHAQASAITILLDVQEKNIHVALADNGRGFDPEKKKTGIGVANMINRVESFNGTMEIESSPGNGCRTEINLPL